MKLYEKKPIITETEKDFYIFFREHYGDKYIINLQVPLNSIIKKNYSNYYITELFRTIDFGFINKWGDVELLIEINDESHNESERKERDKKVKEILEEAEIPLITFWVNKPNTKQYMLDKINEQLQKKDRKKRTLY